LITSPRAPQDSSHHAKNGNNQATLGATSHEYSPTGYSPISQAPITAALSDRALAAMLDLVLISVAFAPFLTLATAGAIRLSQENGYYTLLGIAVWIAFMYQFWTMLVAGRTCGMAWRQLRVAESSNHEFIFPQWRMFARAIAATAAFLFFPINMIFIYLNGHQASLPDLISGTTVVQYSPLRAPGKAS
jgi:hypothetical protein